MKRLALCVALSACAPPAPATTAAPPPARVDSTDDDTRVVAKPREEGAAEACHTSFRGTGDDRGDVARLARGCQAGEKLGDTRSGQQSAEDPVAKFVFAGQAKACYRVFAVGGDGVTELDLMLRGPDGRPIVRDERAGPVAVMPHRAALCLVADGVHTIEVAVARGKGRFSVELWRQ